MRHMLVPRLVPVILLVLLGGVVALQAQSPPLLGPDSVVRDGVGQVQDAEPAVRPHIDTYSNSGCLSGSRDYSPCEEEDQFELTVASGRLRVTHRNATYNCCPDDIVVSLTAYENVLHFDEDEILTMPCDCMCCYDVESSVDGLSPGTYIVEYCWFDYELGDFACYVDEIVVPPARTPPNPPAPHAIVEPGGSPLSPAESHPLPNPSLDSYGNSGCLSGMDEPDFDCGDDAFELTTAGDELYIVHRNATYNCCPDDIAVSLSVVGNHLLLREDEVLTNPCYCLCCYDINSTVSGLAPGMYVVEYCWYDYETDQVECYVDEIIIP